MYAFELLDHRGSNPYIINNNNGTGFAVVVMQGRASQYPQLEGVNCYEMLLEILRDGASRIAIAREVNEG